jgi:hypothetical protein
MSSGGADAVLDRLTRLLREERKYHELFDARLMQSRYRLGLPVGGAGNLDDLPEPLRTQTEHAYLDACREVGQLLLDDGKLREAWWYWRTLGERQPMVAALQKSEVSSENLEPLIELAIHEGLAPVLGLEWVLGHYGTCNAITTFEGAIRVQPVHHQQGAAALLVRHLHNELAANVRSHIQQRETAPPGVATLRDLVAHRPWLFENGNYHIDTSHLSSVVRIGRLLVEEEPLRLALDLTEYGRRLNPQLQYRAEEPFVELYPTHGLFFSAILGEQVEQAVEYFAARARDVDVAAQGTTAIETYVVLLARIGRHAQALDEAAELVPPGGSLSPYAPNLLELARQAGAIGRYLEICRQRGDRLGFTAGLIEAARH